MDLDHVDALANAFNLGYARGRADEEAYSLHCGDTDEPLTNGDAIRAMSDEKLADFLQDVAMQGGIELGGRPTTWFDWLKEEVEDDYAKS